MSVAHFEYFFVLTTAGLGLLLAGGLNLALGGKGRRTGLRALTTGVVCVVVLAGSTTVARAELAVRSAAVLVPLLLLVFLAGSDGFTRQLASLITFLRKPTVRWALTAMGGLAVLVGSGVAFELADEAALEQTMKDLDLSGGRSPTRPVENVHAMTDRGTPIILKEPTAVRNLNDLKVAEERILRDNQRANCVIRRENPTDLSNCHGWVFTAGKFLLSPDDVALILKDNGYHEIHDSQPGDLVVYRHDGAITHTAVVRYVTAGHPVVVEGKWGTMSVFQHYADESCYGSNYTFYRSARHGHTLVGLGGSPAAHAPLHAVGE